MPFEFRVLSALALVALVAAPGPHAHAYTAAGDRIFPATILLPQNAPSDDFYVTPSTQPLHSPTVPGASDQLTQFTFTYDKTITERLGVGVSDGWNKLDQAGAGSAYGWQGLETTVQYLAVSDPDHEFLLSLGGARQWGGGAQGAGGSGAGNTTAGLYFGKGFGDVPVPALQPLALTGTMGYQRADTSAAPDLLVTGIALEYSIPYLVSKVANPNLPDFVRRLTPLVEMQFNTPAGNPRGATTTGAVAPGVTYAGDGWEVGAEALVPTTRAAGSGVGFIAQLHLSLDYFFPDTIGRPLFGPRY